MSQSLVQNYLHIIYSTKNREPFLNESIQEEMFNYLGGICKKLDCQPIIVGGHVDHVHILCMLSKKIALVKLLEDVKSRSSKWVKTIDKQYEDFYWQGGYGAFSVSPSQVDIAKKYIQNQKEHHRVKTFKDEFRGFLKKYRVEYDEQYVWD